jgi:hypothetical protein
MTESPVFVVGAPRSGTGLLRDLLRSHPNLAFPDESHFLPRFYRAHGDPGSDAEARALAGRILGVRWVRAWRVPLDPDDFADCRSYAEVVSRLYGAVAARDGKQRWGDKTPQYVTEIPTLLRLFPRARVLHIVRDGRDVALSQIRVRFGPENVYAAARAWKRFVEIGRRDGSRFPENYLEVRYESLLREPEPTLRAVCDFLGEPFADEVLRPSFLPRRMRRPLIGRPSGWIISETDIATWNVERWRSSMPRSDRAVFETVAGDLLAELGYETEGLAATISPALRVRFVVQDGVRRFWRQLNSRHHRPRTIALLLEAALRSRVARVRRA